jgi:hypothetical protein
VIPLPKHRRDNPIALQYLREMRAQEAVDSVDAPPKNASHPRKPEKTGLSPRTVDDVRTDLAKAEVRWRFAQSWSDGYTGNNPNFGMPESKDAAGEVHRLRDELERLLKQLGINP